MKKDFLRDVWILVFFVAYIFLTNAYLPTLFLFGGGGVEARVNIDKFTIFGVMGWIALGLLAFIKLIRSFLGVHGKKKEAPAVDSILHDPEDSILRKIPLFGQVFEHIFGSIWLTILWSVGFFGALGLVGGLTQNTFFPNTSFPIAEQAISTSANIGLAVYPASPSETLLLAGVITLLLIIFKSGKHLGLYGDTIFNTLKFAAIPILGAFSHLIIHNARYGSNDIAQIAVFNFGLLSSLLMILTMSVIPALMYHDMNNLFQKLFTIYPSDTILLWGGIALAMVFVIAIVLMFFIENKLTTEEGTDVTPT